MLENYRIFRCILDPRVFVGDEFVPEALLRMDLVDRTHERYVISVSFLERFPDLVGAHGYGTRVAADANAAMTKREGRLLASDETVQYIGHYQLRYSALRKRFWNFHTVSFCWRPEGALKDHCEIEVNWNGVAPPSTKRQRTEERREIVEWLFQIVFGPFRFQGAEGRQVGPIDLPEKGEMPAV